MLTRSIDSGPQPPSPPPTASPVAPLSVPSIADLLATGAIRAGQTDLLHSFELDAQGRLQAIRGDLPVTAIIAGKGRSGKSRRMMLMIFQAILLFHATGGGTITICDPHSMKPDGLSNVLASFAPWVRFARTNEQIIAAAKEHCEELESRLTPQGSIHGEGLRPRLLVIDEFSKLMKSEQISKQHKKILTTAVRETAVQWAGVGGRAWVAGQEFTEDAIGDTAIRKDAQAIYCHQLSDEYASFLFPRDSRARSLVAQIARRECVYKDSDNMVRRTMTPTVLDQEIALMVDYLARSVPRRRTRQMQHPSAPTRVPQPFHHLQTEPIAPTPPAAPAAARPSAPGDDPGAPRRQYGHGSRRLHATHIVPQAQPMQPVAHQPIPLEALPPEIRPLLAADAPNVQQAQRAAATWKDTVYVPETIQPDPLVLPGPQTEDLRQSTPMPQQRPPTTLSQSGIFALLIEAESKKQKRT